MINDRFHGIVWADEEGMGLSQMLTIAVRREERFGNPKNGCSLNKLASSKENFRFFSSELPFGIDGPAQPNICTDCQILSAKEIYQPTTAKNRMAHISIDKMVVMTASQYLFEHYLAEIESEKLFFEKTAS